MTSTPPTREELESRLAARWPDAVAAGRASTDETHRLALVHPEYDGFITLEITARTDLDGVFIVPDAVLEPIITAHHRTGPLERGQVLPVDLELHPGRIGTPAATGTIQIVDTSGEAVAPSVRLTLATHHGVECVLAGSCDGPFADRQRFESTIDELVAGRVGPRALARRIERLARPRTTSRLLGDLLRRRGRRS